MSGDSMTTVQSDWSKLMAKSQGGFLVAFYCCHKAPWSRQRIKPSISFDLQFQRIQIYDGRMKEQLRVHVLIYIVTRKRGGGAGNDICLLKTQNPLPVIHETPPSTRSLLPTPTSQSFPNSFPTGHSLFEYMNLWKTFSFMPPQRGSYSFAHMRVSPAVTAMMILRDQGWSTCFTLTNLVMQSFLLLEYFLLSWQHFKILTKIELLST